MITPAPIWIGYYAQHYSAGNASMPFPSHIWAIAAALLLAVLLYASWEIRQERMARRRKDEARRWVRSLGGRDE